MHAFAATCAAAWETTTFALVEMLVFAERDRRAGILIRNSASGTVNVAAAIASY
jgi:hypothetical protein